MRLSPVVQAAACISGVAAASLKTLLAKHESLTILNSLVQQFDLLETFDAATNITLLAPTDDAYRALAQWGFNVSEVPPFIARALLSYHVLDGIHPTEDFQHSDDVSVIHTMLHPPVLTNVTKGAAVKMYGTGAKDAAPEVIIESGLQVVTGVVEHDIEFDSGVLHTVNSSLVLPHNISATAGLGLLTEFLDLMDKADMVSQMESQADVTVFIPHNAALASIRPLLSLLSREQLAGVMGYHVIPGKVLYKSDLQTSTGDFQTMQGSTLSIDVDAFGQPVVGGASVVRSDMIIYGGVAHIIDAALIPREDLLSDEQSAETTLSESNDIGAIPAQPVAPSRIWKSTFKIDLLHLAVLAMLMIGLATPFIARRRRSVKQGSDDVKTDISKQSSDV